MNSTVLWISLCGAVTGFLIQMIVPHPLRGESADGRAASNSDPMVNLKKSGVMDRNLAALPALLDGDSPDVVAQTYYGIVCGEDFQPGDLRELVVFQLPVEREILKMYLRHIGADDELSPVQGFTAIDTSAATRDKAIRDFLISPPDISSSVLDLLRAMSIELYRNSPEDSLTFILGSAPASIRKTLLKAVIAQWAKDDPASCLNYIANLPDLASYLSLLRSSMMSQGNFSAWMAFIDSLPRSLRYDHIVAQTMLSLPSGLPDATYHDLYEKYINQESVNRLKGKNYEYAIRGLFKAVSNKDVALAEDLFNRLPTRQAQKFARIEIRRSVRERSGESMTD